MAVQAHATAQVHPDLGPEGGPGPRSDPRQGRQPGAGDAAVRPQGRRARHRQGAALGRRERPAEGRLRRRRRAAVRDGVLRQPGAVAEAGAPRPDGPRVPRRQAHRAPDGAKWPSGRAQGRGGGSARRAAEARAARRRRRGRRRAAARRRRRPPRQQRRATSERQRYDDGSESSSVRVSARLQQDVALALVRRQGLRQAAPRGPEAARHAEGAVPARRRVEDRDRARRQQAEDRHLHLAPRHHHRPQGHRGGQAEAGDPEATNREVFINIQEIQKPELDAQLIGESVAMQLEKRVAFSRAMRKAVESALRFGARGIKVRVSGRLNGAEIARSEWYLHGQLPLQTLRADIDYGFAEAQHDLRPDRREGVALQGRAPGAAHRP